jgi:phosphoglycolate phosphatase
LREAGATLAVLTNKPEGLSRKLLHELGLASFFKTIAGGDTTPHAKPHPAPVQHVLALLGASGERAVFVGDSEVDAATAMQFAMPFLLFTGGYGANAMIDGGVRARFADYGSLPPLVHALR